MTNEITLHDASQADGREQWLSLMEKDHGRGFLRVRASGEAPIWLEGAAPGFLLPPDFRWGRHDRKEFPSLIIHIETDRPVTASVLGELLTQLERGSRRRLRRSERQDFRLDVVDLGTGSYFLKVVVPVAGTLFSFGSLLNDLYGTFANDSASQRAVASTASKIVIEQGAQAVTLYSDVGVVLRIDGAAATAYRNRRQAALEGRTPSAFSELPDVALEPLRLSSASRASELSGSGRLVALEGAFYVELEGREGALVKIEDLREDGELLLPGALYNLRGQFDTDAGGFPRRFDLREARLI
ncbi:hypothetical protein [Sphingomonas sp. S2-65]|uniref:hypothetical protein n=1 Tax=Sphingomonas sp. S2-65 TaxID=2903960 RepID=UPI001F2A5B27|nr:hypothetical protein [Sphingomonas sp. S2-65]UYY58016.1 hypothetical protein LZ586_15330 [Sphingomonas sp. S2-65]